jgi:hypothetical protein
MGCIARLGCLMVLAIACVVGWFTRDMWLPARFRTEAPAAISEWQPVTNAGAARARDVLQKLSEPRGPVFQTLSAGDVASLAVSEASKRVSGRADSVAARIEGDRLTIRATVSLAELKGNLGPLGEMISDREQVEMSGTVIMVRPGIAALDVKSAKIGRLALPQGMIPRLVKEVDRSRRPAGMPETALPLPVPAYVGDIRIANGKVTLYKNVK